MAADIDETKIGDDLPFDIDFVFPYVNNTDPLWLKQHKVMCEKYGKIFNPNGERYRDYETLKYLFRGIDKCLPWVRNIYMIVERKSQVPKWLDTKKVKIIYHKDIIPASKLPTYNSTTIEMFMHKIPDLAEHFIYGNDDVFPTSFMKKSDFFNAEGVPKLNINKVKVNLNKTSMYRKMIRSSNELASKDLGLKLNDRNYLIKSNHGLSPMIKSTHKRIYKNQQVIILKSCTAFRESFNFNPELFNSWQYLSSQYCTGYSIKMKYIFIESISSENELFNQLVTHQLICLNDGRFKSDKHSFLAIKQIILKAFERYLPNKCQYEI